MYSDQGQILGSRSDTRIYIANTLIKIRWGSDKDQIPGTISDTLMKIIYTYPDALVKPEAIEKLFF